MQSDNRSNDSSEPVASSRGNRPDPRLISSASMYRSSGKGNICSRASPWAAPFRSRSGTSRFQFSFRSLARIPESYRLNGPPRSHPTYLITVTGASPIFNRSHSAHGPTSDACKRGIRIVGMPLNDLVQSVASELRILVVRLWGLNVGRWARRWGWLSHFPEDISYRYVIIDNISVQLVRRESW